MRNFLCSAVLSQTVSNFSMIWGLSQWCYDERIVDIPVATSCPRMKRVRKPVLRLRRTSSRRGILTAYVGILNFSTFSGLGSICPAKVAYVFCSKNRDIRHLRVREQPETCDLPVRPCWILPPRRPSE